MELSQTRVHSHKTLTDGNHCACRGCARARTPQRAWMDPPATHPTGRVRLISREMTTFVPVSAMKELRRMLSASSASIPCAYSR
eukprot:4881628-Prymnesium_polylepis.1